MVFGWLAIQFQMCLRLCPLACLTSRVFIILLRVLAFAMDLTLWFCVRLVLLPCPLVFPFSFPAFRWPRICLVSVLRCLWLSFAVLLIDAPSVVWWLLFTSRLLLFAFLSLRAAVCLLLFPVTACPAAFSFAWPSASPLFATVGGCLCGLFISVRPAFEFSSFVRGTLTFSFRPTLRGSASLLPPA